MNLSYTPAAGDTLQIVSGSSRNETFGTLNGAGSFSVVYNSANVQLVR
ncbi:MAG: hypothetical protein ACYDCC_09235 [Actinomycetota bacterium]